MLLQKTGPSPTANITFVSDDSSTVGSRCSAAAAWLDTGLFIGSVASIMSPLPVMFVPAQLNDEMLVEVHSEGLK